MNRVTPIQKELDVPSTEHYTAPTTYFGDFQMCVKCGAAERWSVAECTTCRFVTHIEDAKDSGIRDLVRLSEFAQAGELMQDLLDRKRKVQHCLASKNQKPNIF